jgi:hypothetical protein
MSLLTNTLASGAHQAPGVHGDSEEAAGSVRKPGKNLRDELLGVGVRLRPRHAPHVIGDRLRAGNAEFGDEVVPGHRGEHSAKQRLPILEPDPPEQGRRGPRHGPPRRSRAAPACGPRRSGRRSPGRPAGDAAQFADREHWIRHVVEHVHGEREVRSHHSPAELSPGEFGHESGVSRWRRLSRPRSRRTTARCEPRLAWAPHLRHARRPTGARGRTRGSPATP